VRASACLEDMKMGQVILNTGKCRAMSMVHNSNVNTSFKVLNSS
jgi:hypothetical protein